jgi:hypothetical protein
MTDSIQAHIELLPRRMGDPPPKSDPHVRIGAELGWILRGPSDALDAATPALIGLCERLGDNILLLNFGNAVGFFDVPGLGRIEVVSGKWSRTDFDYMLAELTEIATGLPFAATTFAALPYDRTVAAQDDILYHMFVYLRHALSEAPTSGDRLLPELRLILRDPYRRFDQARRNVSIDQVRHVDAAALTAIATGKGEFTRVHSHQAAHGPLAMSLRGHLPNRMDERHIASKIDTPENRFVKSFLGSIGGVIDKMRMISGDAGSSVFARRIATECDSLDALLRPIVQHSLWREVGPMVHLPASSPVLQRRRGYCGVYRHFAKMRLAARVPLKPELVRDLIEAKDIAQLYEIWSYFVVVRELTTLLGAPIRADSLRTSPLQLTVPWELENAWGNGTRLLYNPRFSRSHKGQHSFSVPLRPDIALYLTNSPNAGLHLFDAKFKVDKLGEVMPLSEETDDAPSLESEERQGTFKRGDLYKMHTYRDAISSARSVWILYPGTETRFFSDGGRVTTVYDTLPDSLCGVGAAPLLPGDNSHIALRTILSRLLEIPCVELETGVDVEANTRASPQ